MTWNYGRIHFNIMMEKSGKYDSRYNLENDVVGIRLILPF